MKELNKKQKLFCEEYIKNGYNGSKAYGSAYEQENKWAAATWACQLLRDESIRDYIDNVEGSYRIVGYQEGITKSWLLKTYKEMLNATRSTVSGEQIPDWTSRHNAVQGIAKLLGDLTERKKVEIEEKDKSIDLNSMSNEEKEEYRKMLLSEL